MGKTYLITGGTDGIGRAIVEKLLLLSDVDVIIVNYCHNEKKANEFVESLDESDKDKLILIKSDLSEYNGLEELVSQVKNQVNSIDYLICNVGISEYEKFDNYTYDMWERVIRTNLSIPTFLIKELKATINPGGSILLMGSYCGEVAYSSSVVYSISKSGLVFLSKVLVKELEAKQIRINSIAPGFVETNWQSSRSDESRDRINKKIALHRFGMPVEVADIAVATLKNEYMNGSVVDIHGGYDYF